MSVIIFRTLFIAALLFIKALPVLAEEYYVDNAVSISGSGAIDSPFSTIQEGLDNMVPGDTLSIRGNTSGQIYNNSFSFPVSGNSLQSLVVKGHPSEKVILTGTSGSRLNINNDYWIIENLIIDQANIARDAIRLNGSHITLRNLEIRNGRREGISIENASFITIEDSYIHDFILIDAGVRRDAHCIMIDTDRSPTITNVKILRNTIERCSGDGIQIFGVTGQSISTYAKNIEITGNTFIDGTTELGLTENALDFKAGDTVLVKGNTMTGYKNNKTIVIQKGCRNITIEENTLSKGLSGIEMRQEGGASFIQENNRLIRNIIYDMSSYALKFDGIKNLTVANNTLASIGTDSFRFESTLGASTPSVDGGIIKNNLVYSSGNPRMKDPIANVDVSHNGWFGASGGGLSSGTDTTGSDPLFMDLINNNFLLQVMSPVIDAGTSVGLSFFGLAPDLGAFEFNPGTDTTPPNPPTGLTIIN